MVQLGPVRADAGLRPTPGRPRRGRRLARCGASTRRPRRPWWPRSRRRPRQGDSLGGRGRGARLRRARRPGQPRPLGPQARRPAGPGPHEHPGGQGRRDRRRLRRSPAGGAARPTTPSAGTPPTRPTAATPAGPGASRAGMTTGELLVAHVAMKPLATLNRPDAGHGRHGHQGRDRLVQGAHRRDRGAGHGRGGRDHGGAGAGRRGAAQVRRRLDGRAGAQPPGLPGPGAGAPTGRRRRRGRARRGRRPPLNWDADRGLRRPGRRSRRAATARPSRRRPGRVGHVVLVGMMGAGKTTVGRRLAEALGLPVRRQRRAGRGPHRPHRAGDLRGRRRGGVPRRGVAPRWPTRWPARAHGGRGRRRAWCSTPPTATCCALPRPRVARGVAQGRSPAVLAERVGSRRPPAAAGRRPGRGARPPRRRRARRCTSRWPPS